MRRLAFTRNECRLTSTWLALRRRRGDSKVSIPKQRPYERDAEAWLKTIGAATVASVAASPQSTLVPTIRRGTTAGAEALVALDDLAKNPHQLRMGDVLGEGGMGIVREARQVTLGRSVAVKTIKAVQHDPSAALDLLREAWVTGSLEHPNIVPVHYLTMTDDGHPLIVLKRIEGAEWSRLVNDPKEVARRFGVDDLLVWNLDILLHVLNAVRFAHRHEIIHRDIKPSNVMVGDYGEVYLLDWGIAVSLRDDGTGRFPLACTANQLAGTPCYMAPEMLGREGGPPLSKHTDVYLAGAVLYEIVTGHPPHRGSSALAVIASVMASRPEFPHDAPPELVRICERAMHEDPAQRFESIEALQAALHRYLEHRGSEQLAVRGRERLAELRAHLAAGGKQEDIYRLFGACRYGFRDAIAAWPDNVDARHGLAEAVTAVAEYELAADRPQAAVSLLGELDEPHALQEVARSAVATHALRVAALERLGREHDREIGNRTRTVIALAFGLLFVVVPVAVKFVEPLQHLTYGQHIAFTGACIALLIGARVWARESLGATVINRRLWAMFTLLFVAQCTLAIGAWLAAIDPSSIVRLNLLLTFALAAAVAIGGDDWLWPVVVGYLAAFLAACVDLSIQLYAASAANGLFTVIAALRWRSTRARAHGTTSSGTGPQLGQQAPSSGR